VVAEQINANGLIGKQTVVVDGTSGDVTVYRQNGTTLTDTGPARADFAALPLTDPDALEAAVNSMFATLDSNLGLSGDAQELFTINAEQVTLNPLVSPSLRLAIYAALAADDGATQVAAGVKDSAGRVGIEIFASTGSTATDKSKVSYIFDPATGNLLEDDIATSAGTSVAASTVTTFATASTAPADPYAN